MLVTLAIVLIVMLSAPFLWRAWWGDLYLALLVVWIWIPHRQKTFSRNILLTGIIALGLLGVGMSWGERVVTASLMWPLGAVLGGRGHQTPWSQAALVGVAIIEAVLMFPHGLSATVGTLLSLFGAYWGIRYVGVRREAQALERRRLEELEAAYTELKETHEQLIETSREAAEARARQARLETLADIHDGIGHRLTSLIIGLESLDMMMADDPVQASTRVPELVDTARLALQDVRQAVRDGGESPRAEDMEALIAGAQERGHFSVEVDWQLSPQSLPPSLRGTLFHVLQEALTNILRHARAHHVHIHLSQESQHIRFEVSDDGVLQTVGAPGFGIAQMRRRCQAMGGTLQLTAQVPHGLSLLAILPYEEEEDPSHADTRFSGG